VEETWKAELDKMASAIPEGILAVSQDGLITYANQAAKDMLGPENKDIVGLAYDDPALELAAVDGEALPKDDHPVARALRSGCPVIGAKVSLRRPGGAPVFLYVNTAPHGPSVGVIMTFRDITKEQHDEQILKESEAKYRTLVEHVPAITYIAALDCVGTSIYISPQIDRLLGFSQDEYMSDPNFWQDHIYPEDRERVMMELTRSMQNHSPFVSEYRMVTRADSVRWFRDEAVIITDSEGNPLFFQGVMFDITERKQIESALKESDERHRALFEKAADAIFILRAEGEDAGNIISANPAAARMHGYTVDELQALNMVKDIDVPETARKAPGRIERVLGGEWIKFEAMHRRKDGSTFPVEVHAGLLEIGDQKCILAFDRDITARKRTEELSDSLNRINAAINSTLDFGKIMKRVVVKASRAIGCEAAKVDLREGGFWIVRNLYGLPKELLNESFSDKEAKYAALAAKTRKPVVSNDAYNDRRVNPELMKKYDVRSLLAIPLIVRAEVIGVLVFMYRSAPVAFTEPQIDFANKLATSISLALENARLYSTERNISNTLQETLLSLPQEIPCIDFGHLYRSATETARVGGDFYDVFELGHGRVGLLIGDVSGKGVEAATLTALVKNTIKAYAYDDSSPATVIRKANEVVLKSSAPTMFVTLFLGVLDPVTGRLIYCNAGHPPAFLKRSGANIEFLATGSPAAGAFPNLDFIDDVTTMDEDDMLVLYTDGVIEARCNSGFFGEEKLLNVVKGLERIKTKDVPRIIFDSILKCTGGKLSDDLAIMAVSLAKI